MASQACLSIPQYWDDPTLLSEEPLLTEFMVREKAGESRRRGALKWPKRIAEQLLKIPSGRIAVAAWLKIAFCAINEKEHQIPETKFFATTELTESFVEVLWLIRQKNSKEALLYLNRERRRRGFTYDLPKVKPLSSLNLGNQNLGNRPIEHEAMDVDGPTDQALPEHGAVVSNGCSSSVLNESSSVSTALDTGRKRANSDGSRISAPPFRRKGPNIRPKGQQVKAVHSTKNARRVSKSSHKSEVARRLTNDGSRVAGGSVDPSPSIRGPAHASQPTQPLTHPRKRRCNEIDNVRVTPNAQPKPQMQNANQAKDRPAHSHLAPSRPDFLMERSAPYLTARLTHPSGGAVQPPSASGLNRDIPPAVERTSWEQSRLPIAPSPATHLGLNHPGNHHIAPLPTRPMHHDQPINARRVSSHSTRGPVHAFQSTQSLTHPRKRRCNETDNVRVAPNAQPKPQMQNANQAKDRRGRSHLAPSRPDWLMEWSAPSMNTYSTARLAHPSGGVVQPLSTSGLNHDILPAVKFPTVWLPPLQSSSTTLSPATHLGVNHPGNHHIAPLPTRPTLHGQSISQPNFKMPDSGQEQTDELIQSSAADVLDREGACSPWPNWDQETSDTDHPELSSFDEPDPVTVRDDHPDFRPSLTGNPPIWAKSRQELCESFPFFRSYQGGVYFANDVVKGYLLSGFAASRDLFHHDGKLIISHGGGKAESIHENRTANDQMARDKSVRALLANYKDRRPVVLIADDRYKLFPYNLADDGYTYVVLGFYVITQVWGEYQPASNDRGRVVRYKFAFQWCPSQGEPWWTRQMPLRNDLSRVSDEQQGNLNSASERGQEREALSAIGTTSRSRPSRCAYDVCQQCRIQTPEIYSQGWMCLNPECPAFWKMKNGNYAEYQLSYNTDFLHLEPPDSFPVDLVDICPAVPPTEVPDRITTTYLFTRGWHCRLCGRLSCRYKWQYWECANCGNVHETKSRIRGPKEFWGQIDNTAVHHVNKSSGISKPFSRMYNAGPDIGNGEYIQFILPHGRGRIHLLRGNPRINQMADKIFEDYQIEATDGNLQFRRYPLKMHKCRGTLLTNYFSQNSGEPYQYVGGTGNTTPFSVAPMAVKAALDLIKTRAGLVMNSKPEFNEILSAAYMERQKMAFHSDSERGLGPTVASLSLGSAAVMHFRPSASLRLSGEGREIALTLHLQHGDVLVMDGAGIQECYEHTVVPCNFRIAATARWIGSEHQ